MHTDSRVSAVLVAGREVEAGRRAFAAVALVFASVFVAYWPTTVSMVETWSRSATYTHGFLVVPAVLWFVWQARRQLAAAPVAPWWPALVPLAGAGALWLTGELASALAPKQWGMVLTIPLSVVALFGLAWGRILAFPLAFLLFAVPFGEALTPTLIDWTADFTVAALRTLGIPVYREGAHFVIPSGRWSVVEACSGIRYLTATIVVGVLYAWTIYSSSLRRAVFIVAAIAVPIVANWIRALLIVLTGHFSSNRLAVGIDHLIAGWIFFGVVIGLLFWIGARWREDVGPALSPSNASAAIHDACPWPSRPAVAVVALLVAAWPMFARFLATVGDSRPVQLVTVVPAAEWEITAEPISSWTPALQGAARVQSISFARQGQQVTAFMGFYRNQRQDRELVNSLNRLAPEKGPTTEIVRGRALVEFGDESATVRTATLRHLDQRLRVWHWYWLDGVVQTSDMTAKLSLALDRVLLRSDTSAWVALYVETETDAEGDRVLSEFLRQMGPALNSAMQATAAR